MAPGACSFVSPAGWAPNTILCERIYPRWQINGISLSKPCSKIKFKGKRFEEVLTEGNWRPPTGAYLSPNEGRSSGYVLASARTMRFGG
jgi:hypothetical protein